MIREVSLAIFLVLTIATTGLESSSEVTLESIARISLLKGIDKLYESVPNDYQKSSLIIKVLDSFKFRLTNGRFTEKSPRELIDKMVMEIQSVLPEKVGNGFEETLEQIRLAAPDVWGTISIVNDDNCEPAPSSIHEVTLDDLTSRCTKGGEDRDVFGCIGAATLYCHKLFPKKSFFDLVGLVTDRKGSTLTIACIEQAGLLFASQPVIQWHCRHICETYGAERVCEIHRGPEYGAFYADRVSMKTLGEEFENHFMMGCFKYTKKTKVEYRNLQAIDSDCRARNPYKNYSCLKAASSYCRNHGGYTGGVIQYAENDQTAVVACYNAFYTGDVHISRDPDFLNAKNSLKKVCNLEFEIDKGKILSTMPEMLKTERYDNRKSSTDLRSTFEVSESVTTTNQFSHSHSFGISAEYSLTVKIPFFEKGIKISASYTATISLTKSNSKTQKFTHKSDVVVPPGKGVVKKAIITRTNMDVPWRAVGINGLGRRVEISGTWAGVDVSNLDVQQEDI